MSAVFPGKITVDGDGVTFSDVAAVGDLAVDVLIEDRRVWSFWPVRDSTQVGDVRLARWPAQLAARLVGRGRVQLRTHPDGKPFYDQEVVFDSSAQRLSVVDDHGHPLAVDKDGRLRRLFADVDASARLGLLDAIEEVVHLLSGLGLDAFVTYGTLLGAVRDGTFIGHDHDADLGYLSSFTHPCDVMVESFRIERAVQHAGYSTRRHSGFAFMVDVVESGTRRGLDVFGAFIRDDVLFHMGEVSAPLRPDQVVPLGSCQLLDRAVPAPADTAAWLEATYGPQWRVPDPAFKFRTPQHTRRRLTGWFRGTRRHRARWDDFYLAHGEAAEARIERPFAEWVLTSVAEGDTILDAGCGNGADVRRYARGRCPTIGLDYSRQALDDARALTTQEGLPARFLPFNANDLRSVLATGATAVSGGRTHLTAHLFANALDAAGRDGLWRLAAMVGRTGGSTFVATLGEPGAVAPGLAEGLLSPVGAHRLTAEVEERGGTMSPRHSREPGVDWWQVTWA